MHAKNQILSYKNLFGKKSQFVKTIFMLAIILSTAFSGVSKEVKAQTTIPTTKPSILVQSSRPQDTIPPSEKQYCVNPSDVTGPNTPPTPFLFLPYRASSFDTKTWNTQMDHTSPNYQIDGMVSTLGEKMKYDGHTPAFPGDSSEPMQGGTWSWATNDQHAPPTFFPYNVNPTTKKNYIHYYESRWLAIALELGDVRDSYLGYDGHDGQDFGVSGDALAAGGGEVARALDTGGKLGKIVEIYHHEGYLTRYAHLASFIVSKGNPVTPGQKIGVIGGTGGWPTHLHFSVYRWDGTKWRITDPFGWDPYQDTIAQRNDPLKKCNSEVSYNLWYGWWPQPYNAAAQSRIASHKQEYQNLSLSAANPRPSNDVYLGGWLGDIDDPSKKSDSALFVSDITISDGTIISPNQTLTKTWRVKNSGTSTWSGYKLKFISGERMGGPTEIAVPTTAPGATVDLSIGLISSSTIGIHNGAWQIVSAGGTWVPGGQMTVKINVQTQSGGIIINTDPPSPSSSSIVRIHARANSLANFRAMRIKIDGNVKYEIGAPEAYWNWNTTGYASGQHTILVEATDQTDTSWSRPKSGSLLYTLTGTSVSTNHAPNRPTLISNPAYDWYVTIGNAPQLCAQAQGDPDNDAITQYRFVAEASVGISDSGWVGNSCHSFGSITPGTYTWYAQVKDAQGGISQQSDPWHFTVEPSGVNAYIDHFSVASPSNAEQIKIFACSSGHAGVNITLRVLVNEANDGSDAGRWNIIKEQGSPCFNDNDAPIWNTLGYKDGAHKVRVVAMAIQPDAGAVSDATYVLNHRQPNSPELAAPVPASGSPQEAIYLNSTSLTFKWKPAVNVQSYTLHVSTNSSPSADPNPVFRQTFASTINEYTVNLGQAYSTLYWQVQAINDVGNNNSNNQLFGIDQQAPTCNIVALPSKTYSNLFQVNWNSTDNLSGVQYSDIQFMDSVRGVWENWLANTPTTKTYDLFNGQPGHTYFFRCRAVDAANNQGIYPSAANTSIQVDPFSQPGTPWWDHGYGAKRNIVILNNMPGIALPQGYPIHLHFDGSTTPTAAALYNASLSSSKCDDLRITYNDAVELNRIVQRCTSNNIDLWFRSGVSVASGDSDHASHQLYYGNVAASVPAADPNQVWYPYKENDTTNLYFFQEGSGSTTVDSSGNGMNCSIGPAAQWSGGKFGNGIQINQQSSGGVRSLYCSPMIALSSFTVEFWINTSAGYDGRIIGSLGGGGNGGPGNNWMIDYRGRIHLEVWPCPPCGSHGIESNFNLRDAPYTGKWNHVAVTFNGGNQVSFYINGNLDSTKTIPDQSGINTYGLPLEIGATESGGQFASVLAGLRISNTVKSSFPYGTFAQITNEPTIATDAAINPPVVGAPDLALISLSTYPNSTGGVLVEAVVQNIGNLNTQSGFYTDLYLNHLPTSAGDFTANGQFWVNDPIGPGETVTLTTVIPNLSTLGLSATPANLSTQATATFTETCGTLYAQTDSAGLVTEPDDQNNIYSVGAEICTATPDSFEADNTFGTAQLITVGNPQTHNFDKLGDVDWIKLSLQEGKTYRLTTSNLGISADTYLDLYDSDGQTLLVSNDDFENSLTSQIEWKAVHNGTYYALVKNWNPNTGGFGTGYAIQLTEVPPPTQLKTFISVAAQDGWIVESSENGNKGGRMNTNQTILLVGDDSNRKQYRGILSFNTGAGLPDNAVISKVTLKFKQQSIAGGGNPVTAFQGFVVDLKNGMFGMAALQLGDFQAGVSKSYGPFKPIPVSNWYSINLTNGQSYVNKLSTNGGLTQIRLRFKLDDNNNAVANYLSLYTGNAPAAANRPQLTITYYVP